MILEKAGFGSVFYWLNSLLQPTAERKGYQWPTLWPLSPPPASPTRTPLAQHVALREEPMHPVEAAAGGMEPSLVLYLQRLQDHFRCAAPWMHAWRGMDTLCCPKQTAIYQSFSPVHSHGSRLRRPPSPFHSHLSEKGQPVPHRPVILHVLGITPLRPRCLLHGFRYLEEWGGGAGVGQVLLSSWDRRRTQARARGRNREAIVRYEDRTAEQKQVDLVTTVPCPPSSLEALGA